MVGNSLGQRRAWMCFGIGHKRTSNIKNKGMTKFPVVTVSLCNLSYDAQVKREMPWLSQLASIITLKTHVTQDNVEGDSPQDQGHQCPDDDFNNFRFLIHFITTPLFILNILLAHFVFTRAAEPARCGASSTKLSGFQSLLSDLLLLVITCSLWESCIMCSVLVPTNIELEFGKTLVDFSTALLPRVSSFLYIYQSYRLHSGCFPAS